MNIDIGAKTVILFSSLAVERLVTSWKARAVRCSHFVKGFTFSQDKYWTLNYFRISFKISPSGPQTGINLLFSRLLPNRSPDSLGHPRKCSGRLNFFFFFFFAATLEFICWASNFLDFGVIGSLKVFLRTVRCLLLLLRIRSAHLVILGLPMSGGY